MAMTTTWTNPLVIQQAPAQGGAASGTETSTLVRAVQVADVVGNVRTVTGGAGNKMTILVSRGADAITDVMAQATNNTVDQVVRPATIDDDFTTVAVGQTLVSTCGRDGGAGVAGVAVVSIICQSTT